MKAILILVTGLFWCTVGFSKAIDLSETTWVITSWEAKEFPNVYEFTFHNGGKCSYVLIKTSVSYIRNKGVIRHNCNWLQDEEDFYWEIFGEYIKKIDRGKISGNSISGTWVSKIQIRTGAFKGKLKNQAWSVINDKYPSNFKFYNLKDAKDYFENKTLNDLAIMPPLLDWVDFLENWHKKYPGHKGYKAFAYAGDDIWKWEPGFSEEDAVKKALEECNYILKRKSSFNAPCIVVKVGDKSLTYGEQAEWSKKIYGVTTLAELMILRNSPSTKIETAKKEPTQTQQEAEKDSNYVSALHDCKGPRLQWTNCVGAFTHPSGKSFDGSYQGTKYVGEWKDGKMHGHGTFTLPDGEKYVGEFKDGLPHGRGTSTWPDGLKYVGEWKDDKMHGQGTFTLPDGTKYAGEWNDGKRHGQGTLTYTDGTVDNGIWENNKLVESNKIQTQIAKKEPTQTQQVAEKKKKKIKLFNFGREKKTITMEEVVLLGKYEKFNSYPEGMLKEFKTCKKQFCRGKKAGKKVYEIFVMRSPLWHERHPGDIIHGMAWFEIMYLEKLRKTQKQIERYTKNGPDGYPNDFKKQTDVNNLHALIKTNKGRIKMREALGLSAKDDLATVLRRHWLLGDFLNNDTYKVKKVGLNSDLKKRKKLLEKYQASLKKYKEKLEKENKK